MWVYDRETLKFLADDVAVLKYGYTREEFQSMTIKDIRPPEDVPNLLDYIKSISAVIKEAGVWRHIKKDGSMFIDSISSVYLSHLAELVVRTLVQSDYISYSFQ